MATPDPIVSGKYFCDVALAACRKRTPDFVPTSSHPSCAAASAGNPDPTPAIREQRKNDLRPT